MALSPPHSICLLLRRFCGVLESFNCVCATEFKSNKHLDCILLQQHILCSVVGRGLTAQRARPSHVSPHINLSVLLPLITGEVQPELQVQGAHRGKRLQHLRLPPLEARRQADVCLAERTGEAAARSQGPAEAPVHPLPAHAPVLAAPHRTLSGIRLPRRASPTMRMSLRQQSVHYYYHYYYIMIIIPSCPIQYVHLLQFVTFIELA